MPNKLPEFGSVSREAIRLWCIKFGAIYARRLKQKHRGYGVAHRELIPETIHSAKQYENNRAEQSHETIRVRERGAEIQVSQAGSAISWCICSRLQSIQFG